MNNYSPKQLIDGFMRQFAGATADRTTTDRTTTDGRASSDAEKLDQSQMRSLLESLLRKLNLVTREEFDAQAAVLLRTRKKLQDLEAQLADLETKIRQ